MDRGIATSSRAWDFLLEFRLPTVEERRQAGEWLRTPGSAANLAFVALLFGLWGAAFYPTLAALVDRWSTDENYSHGFLTPIVCVYLALQNFKTNPIDGPVRGGIVPGSAMILLGMAFGCVTVLFPSLLAECLAMLAVLAGAILLLGGREWWKRLQTPTLFLLFAVPWPSALYSRIAFPLQQIVCQASSVVIELFGIPVLREGNVMQLPGRSMHVAQACSGMRQLTAFLAIATCAAILMNRPKWYRAILLLSAVPIAVAVNVLRVSAMGLIIAKGDPAWIQGTMHTVEGLVMVALGMAMLWCEVRVLEWMLESDERRAAAPTVATAKAA